MALGVLMKDTTLHNDVCNITVPKGTVVYLLKYPYPTVIFKGFNIVCRRVNGEWFMEAYGEKFRLKFPKGGECYPFSYFKNH